MRKMILGSILALSLAGPALAQWAPPPPNPSWDPGRFWAGAPQDPRQRIDYLQNRINHDYQNGKMNPQEAMDAQRELQNIRKTAHQMHEYDGRLTPQDAQILQARLDDLSRRIHWAVHNGY